jgi:hypothetical protein
MLAGETPWLALQRGTDAMRRPTTIRTALTLFAAAMLGGAAGPASFPAQAGIILETATPGPNPTPAVGLAGIQWIGARFSVTQPVLVDHIGANLEGASTIFGAIVPLSGPGGLPTMPPSQIESYALAGTSFPVTLTIADVSVPLSVALGPGNYGVVFGVGPFNSNGGANLTGGNIPTPQASFFSALPFNGDVWLDQPTLSGLRLFVLGTQAVPEPSSLVLVGTAAVAGFGLWLHRRRPGAISGARQRRGRSS